MEISSASVGVGSLVTVLAVSGSVALVAAQVHKCLVSQFMKKVQSEFRSSGSSFPRKFMAKNTKKKKKKVRFAEDVVEPSSNNDEYRRRRCRPLSAVSAYCN